MRFPFVALLLAFALKLLVVHEGSCSGIDITNIQRGALSGGSTTVTFDATWTNSWRSTGAGAPAPNNWDAAWIFVKFRKNGGDWAHASLNDTGHSTGSGTAATIAVGYPDTSSAFNIATNPGVGVFLYRSGDGVGTFATTGTSLSWNYSQDGVTGSDTVDIRVFAIEMVYLPVGDFFAGDNATSTSAFKQGSTDTDPWWIGSENEMSVTNTTGNVTGTGEKAAVYYYPGDGDAAGSVFTIPAAFPKGYQAHYMMKGEVSQGQWVGFFNTLTATQKSTRDITSASGKNSDNLTYRNNVSWSSGDATLPDQGGGASYEAVAMNYISWADLTAYLDWSGLRPMSELEFERAGRGPYRAESGEYAWGSTSLTQATSLSNSGLPTERAQSGANAAYGGHASVQGPFRVGSFAYGVATRIAAGAGYYGAMELSGNLWERAVTVGNSTGRSFAGRNHGNGVLDSSGNPDVSTWPGSGAAGSGLRGGNWDSISAYARLSDRYGATSANSSRIEQGGGRGVRSIHLSTYFCGGDGTAGNPYSICDLDSLRSMAFAPTASFIITSDIDASATANSNGGAGWLPIGTSAAPFTGTLDGQNRVISGLKIYRPTGDNVGLFGVASATSTIKNINFTNVGIVGRNYVGSTAGQSSGVIQNVTVQGSVQGTDQVGGIIGYLGTATGSIVNSSAYTIEVSGTTHIGGIAGNIGGGANITTSWSSGTVTGNPATGAKVGGIAGRLSDATISRSYSSATISANNEVGGIAGKVYTATGARCTIEYSHASGSVTAVGASGVAAGFGLGAGGLVGVAGNCLQVIKSYATGNVISQHTNGGWIGGLVGNVNWGSFTIEDSFATGNVTSSSANAGGLLGGGGIPISRCYATGSVNAPMTSRAGGLAASASANVSNSFSTGVVSGTATTLHGGLMSTKSTWVTLTNLYWLKPTGSPFTCIGDNAANAQCTTLSDSSFFSQAGGSLYSTWDFTTVWTFPAGGGLPILRE